MGDKKLGQRLIEKGLLTDKQLQNALRAQLIVGGQLDTCLIELGLIDESTLGAVLSEVFGVPHAPPEALVRIPEATIALVPAKVAEEYRVIPFRIIEKVLHMAMVDPGNLPDLDALSFATDMHIAAWVAPELRIYQALEEYYGVARRQRYIGICNALDAAPARREASGHHAAKGAPAGDAGGAGAAPDEGGRAKHTVSMKPVPDVDLELSFDHDLGFDYGRNWHEIAAELRLDDPDMTAETATDAPGAAAAAAPAPPARPVTSRDASRRIELVDVGERLCGADSKEDVADAMLSYATARMARALLFGVHKNVAAAPWRAKGFEVDRFPEVRLPLTSGIFELLLGNELYRGVLPREAKYEVSYRILGVERPNEILLVPLYMGDRLVAVFHGDGGPKGKIAGATDDYVRLCRLFGPTLNLLILKTKIRDAAHPPSEVRKKKLQMV